MAKFKFKFDNVKKVKETLETITKKEIALIDKEIEKEKMARKKLIEDAEEQKKSFTKNSMKASEFRFLKNFSDATEKKIENIDQSIQNLDKKREVKMDELVEKKKENKILAKLEENMQKEFDKEQNKLDLKKFDEIATQKFVRQKK